MSFDMSARMNAQEAYDKLAAMELRSKNFFPIFEKVLTDASGGGNAENFGLGGLPAGGWAPLSPVYGAWKAIRFPGAPPMVRTGRLFASLIDLRGPENSIRPKSATFGTEVEYAKFHQYGTTKMPKRKIVFEPVGFSLKTSEDMALGLPMGRSHNG
jgi:phage gpG-like protein